MLEFINSWAKGIIVAVIIAVVIEMLLPNGNNKKYIKIVISLYVMFSIVYPIVSAITGKTINFEMLLENEEAISYDTENIELDLRNRRYL